MQNGVIYFVPFNANAVGTLYLEKHHFELVKIPNLAAESYKFWGWVWGWLIGTNSNGFSGRILLHFWLDESCRFLHDPVIFTLPVDYS